MCDEGKAYGDKGHDKEAANIGRFHAESFGLKIELLDYERLCKTRSRPQFGRSAHLRPPDTMAASTSTKVQMIEFSDQKFAATAHKATGRPIRRATKVRRGVLAGIGFAPKEQHFASNVNRRGLDAPRGAE